jgi:hypothetical protein
MRSFFQKKLWIALLAMLALGALTVLALSLDSVSFHEAQQFGRKAATESSPIPLAEIAEIWADIPLWKYLVLWGAITLMVILLGLLLSPEARKRLFLLFIRTSLMMLGIFYVLRNYGAQLLLTLRMPASLDDQQSPLANAPPAPEFQPPQISPMMSYLVSFAFALLLVILMWGLYQGWKKYVALIAPPSLDEIARIARSSLHDLNSGRDSSDVIINCYLRMSDVVADKRQLKREIAMTPQEFALRLERAGLPGDAVRRLTRLFEIVRYGDRKSAPKDVTEAVGCLNTILYYCGETI